MRKSYSKLSKVVMMTLVSILAFLPLVFCLTGCAPLDKSWVVNNLFPNIWVFIAQLISAAILIVVMTWLVWKPTKSMLQKRHDFIANEINEATKAKEAATIQLNEVNQLKVDALSQAMGITTQAKAEAFEIIEQAKSEAKQVTTKMKNDAQKDIEQEKESVRAKAQDNIINIAFDIANSVLEKEVSKQDKDKYIDELLDSISSDLKKGE